MNTVRQKMKMDPSLDLLVGHTVSHVWFGHFSALFLELGELSTKDRTRRDGSPGNPRGEFTVYAGFDWRIERPKSVYGSRDCSRRRQRTITMKLLEATVASVTTCGRLPELEIGFSNGLWLVTFGLGRGDPDWTVSFNRPSTLHLSPKRGRLAIDRRDFDPTKSNAESGPRE